jgi:colanic acid biosynthesis glycosyl transferase WcaI
VPSKLYPILAAGRPYIAAVDPSSEVAAITRRHQCGVVVAPGDVTALVSRILDLADDAETRGRMGRRAREASSQFDRSRQVAAHAALIREVATCAR